MGKNIYENYLHFAKTIALYAGKEMMQFYHTNISRTYKDDKTVVTTVDQKINHYLIEQVQKNFPEHSVMGEEENCVQSSDYVWVCDPLDGTGMYVNHVPVFVFSLALVYKGEPIIAVIYDPNEKELYSAIKGKGAYCNDLKISVNKLMLGDLGYRTNIEIFNNDLLDEVSLINDLKSDSKISSIGSVARSCMAIATGNFSCDIFPGTEHGNCDIAASYLIVTEAGGKVTDFYGNDQRYDEAIKGAIISNDISHEQILNKVQKYLK